MFSSVVRLHRFYGDFNCPFCFVQNERLIASGGGHLIEWRGVVHMSWLSQPMQEDPKDETLLAELETLKTRAPDVPLPQHDSRPNTMLATLAVAETRARDRREGRHLKDAIYRAFWRDGRDISNPKVLRDLCSELRIPGVSKSQGYVDVQQRWQSEWENGPYNRRLPTLHSRDGSLSLGLATSEQLSEFVWTNVDHRNEGDSC